MVLFVCVDLILLLIVAFKIGIISVFKNIIKHSIMIGIFVQLFKKVFYRFGSVKSKKAKGALRKNILSRNEA